MTGQPETFHSKIYSGVVSLSDPIESMFLIHKALKSEAARVEEMVRLLVLQRRFLWQGDFRE